MDIVQAGPTRLEIVEGTSVLELIFEPRACRWTLDAGSGIETGDFDRLTKRVRQILTNSSKLEEEG